MIKKTLNGVDLNIVKDYQELSAYAADFVIQRIAANPQLSLLVPTGTTPEGFYALLQNRPTDFFDHTTFYNLDEYCIKENGEFKLLPASDERSYHFYMQKHLFEKFPRVRSYFPTIENAQHEGTYDAFINQNGGIDLCVDAIGEDGHTFGFNLPGTSFQSQSRLIIMNEGTKNVNHKLTGQEIPEYAVTTGLQTGMNCREVILLVSGKRKADIFRKIIWDEISEQIPTTILRNHPNCHWVIDEDTASLLE